MTQQTFAITGRKPRVVLEQLAGNLTVQPWDRQEISVETDGPIAVLQQENDTVILRDCKTDLLLRVPAIQRIVFPIVTTIEATGVSRNVMIDGAGDVLLRDIGGNVSLRDIYGDVALENVSEVAELTSIDGNLRATAMPRLSAQKGVGGNAWLADIARIEIDAVGGNLSLAKTSVATIGMVGGNLDADAIEATLRCNAVGGNSSITNCASAEITLSKVGGNLQIDGAKSVQSSLVGGNLRVGAAFPPESSSRFYVGGNARVFLPESANLSIHGLVGGNASSDSTTFTHGGGFVNVSYGEGAATLSIHVGGNLKVFGGGIPRNNGGGIPWSEFGREMAGFGREMGRVGRQFGREFAAAFHQGYEPGKYD